MTTEQKIKELKEWLIERVAENSEYAERAALSGNTIKESIFLQIALELVKVNDKLKELDL